MPLPESFTTVTKFSKIIALILFVLLPFGGFYLGMKYQASIDTGQNIAVEERVAEAITDSPTPIPTVAENKTGIITDRVLIKELAATALWEDDNVSYSLDKIYQTPEIADMGHFRDNFKKITWVAAHLSIQDNRTTGDRRNIPVANYLRIRNMDKVITPIENKLYLSPLETASIFIVFPVDKEWVNPNLLAGILKQPNTIPLDFNSAEVKQSEGVFLLREGVLESYPVEE